MRTLTLSMIFVACLTAPQRGAAQQAEPCEPRVTPADGMSRGLPHTFHDQAMESIRAMHPEHRILAERHSGRIGAIEYALVAYQEAPADSVRIASMGVSRETDRTWYVEADCGASGWTEGLLEVMEALAGLPHGQ